MTRTTNQHIGRRLVFKHDMKDVTVGMKPLTVVSNIYITRLLSLNKYFEFIFFYPFF